MKQTYAVAALLIAVIGGCPGEDVSDDGSPPAQPPPAQPTPASVAQGINPGIADVVAAYCECWIADEYESEVACLEDEEIEGITFFIRAFSEEDLSCMESSIAVSGASTLAVFSCLNNALAEQAACIRAAGCDDIALMDCIESDYGSDCSEQWTEADHEMYEQAEEMCPE